MIILVTNSNYFSLQMTQTLRPFDKWYKDLNMMCCTFSCAHEQAGSNPLVFYLAADLPLLVHHQITSLRLCLEKKQCDSWVKVYSAFDLHIC